HPEFRFPSQSEDYSAQSHPTTTDLINQTISESDAVMADAWALRRLAEAFPYQKVVDLPQPAQWLLRELVNDHFTKLGEHLARVHSLLQLPLSFIVGQDPREYGEPRSNPEQPLGPDIQRASLVVFGKVKKVDGLVFNLFAN